MNSARILPSLVFVNTIQKSSYIMFFMAKQNEIKEALGDEANVTSISKRSAEMWYVLSTQTLFALQGQTLAYLICVIIAGRTCPQKKGHTGIV